MMDRQKLIELIKEWRAESNKLWVFGQNTLPLDRGLASAYIKCADQLEKLVGKVSEGEDK